MFALQHIQKSFEDKKVLDDINLAINPRDVIALIGENGSGKTTLLKILLGELQPDSGNVSLYYENIGYVPQEAVTTGTIEYSFNRDIDEWRIDYVLGLVGLDKSKNTKVCHLSGGQKTRLAFARVLANEPVPTILLLDEPTNNLDKPGLDWLEGFIKSFGGSVVLVSHDRSFINKVTTRVVELHKGKLAQYGGNYDFYKSQKEIELQAKVVEYEKYTGEKKRLQKIRRQKSELMRRASNEHYDKLSGILKMTFNSRKNSLQTSFGKQIKALNSKLEQLDEVERPEVVKDYRVSLLGSVPNSKLIIRLNNIHKSYATNVLNNVSFEIHGSEKLHISGPNGCGKTTLLKIAAKLIEPDAGEVSIGANVTVGYFSQDVDNLDYDSTGYENLQSTGTDSMSIFHEARCMGLDDGDLKKKPSQLSRGQQAKLGFIKLLLAQNQLLVLDEPTNHLDIPTRERIEAALRRYEGAILIASHDEYFLNQLNVTRVISLGSELN